MDSGEGRGLVDWHPTGRFEALGMISQLRREVELLERQLRWVSDKLEASIDREVKLLSQIDEKPW